MSDVTIRPMAKADLPLMVDWLKQPHVAAWYHNHEPTLDAVTEKYLPRIRGKSPTKMFVICIGDKAIGMVQAYRIDDYPEYAEAIGNPDGVTGLDLFIGDPNQIGKGIGSKVLEVVSMQTIPAVFPDTKIVIASPSVNNPASIRAFVKAGFEKGPVISVPGQADSEQVVTLRLDTE